MERNNWNKTSNDGRRDMCKNRKEREKGEAGSGGQRKTKLYLPIESTPNPGDWRQTFNKWISREVIEERKPLKYVLVFVV